MRVIFEDGQRVPVKVWARDPPKQALRQLQVLAGRPYVVEHVAAMPDVHLASGVAVGTVFATEDTLVPAALGGNLGCGMSAQRLPLAAATLSRGELRRLLAELGRRIPVGDAVQPVPLPLQDELLGRLSTSTLCRTRDALAPRHLGTLGGGNHFVEFDRDGGGDLWVLVHSGSRGIGAAIHAHHLRAAAAADPDPLGGLSASTPAGSAYLADQAFALCFARHNRRVILRRAVEAVADLVGASFGGEREGEVDEAVDIHHNFIAREPHFGRPLYIHRKGAIAAPDGGTGIVPGSMGTASYLVRGLGEASSFCSCSHGAGRVMGRGEARRKVKGRSLIHAMRAVVFDERRAADLVEEGPFAYRDIREVLEDEADLCVPTVRLTPLAVLKG